MQDCKYIQHGWWYRADMTVSKHWGSEVGDLASKHGCCRDDSCHRAAPWLTPVVLSFSLTTLFCLLFLALWWNLSRWLHTLCCLHCVCHSQHILALFSTGENKAKQCWWNRVCFFIKSEGTRLWCEWQCTTSSVSRLCQHPTTCWASHTSNFTVNSSSGTASFRNIEREVLGSIQTQKYHVNSNLYLTCT